MPYVAGRIAESFKTDFFVIWSEDNSEKLVICCHVLGGADKDEDGMGTVEEDVFLRQLENTMLDHSSFNPFTTNCPDPIVYSRAFAARLL